LNKSELEQKHRSYSSSASDGPGKKVFYPAIPARAKPGQKIKKLSLCQNLEALRQHFLFFEDWRNFGNPQKLGKFLKLGVALILRYLLTALLLIQRKLALV